jgi:hypothetical protein
MPSHGVAEALSRTETSISKLKVLPETVKSLEVSANSEPAKLLVLF